MIAAASNGHEEVLQYLLTMGNPDPDPEPQPAQVSGLLPGYTTTMLAAIGQGHPGVVKLIAGQPGFNPTRKVGGKTYLRSPRAHGRKLAGRVLHSGERIP